MKLIGSDLPEESPAVRRLDDVFMTESDRAVAKDLMRRTEAAVDLMAAAFESARKTTRFWKSRMFPSAHRRIEAHLAKAVDRVDLEHRMRALERRPTAFLDGG